MVLHPRPLVAVAAPPPTAASVDRAALVADDLHVDQQLQLLRALYRAEGELHDRENPLLHTLTRTNWVSWSPQLPLHFVSALLLSKLLLAFLVE